MEIFIKGAGEVVIRYVDSSGRTLVQQRLVATGSSAVQAKAKGPLTIRTTNGETALLPILVYRSNRKQEVRFDSLDPVSFAKTRAKNIGCPPEVTQDAAEGRAMPLGPEEMKLPRPGPTSRRRRKSPDGTSSRE